SFAGQVPEIEPGDGMIGWVAQEGKTALASDVADDPRYQALGLLAETRSEIALPLRVEERVLGVLDVQSDRLNAFDDEDVFLLETLAAQLALAVEQAQTYDAERRLRQRLEALIEVSQALVSLLDLDDLLDRVVEAISDTFGFERVHIFVIVEDRLVFRAGSGTHSVRWLIDELSYALDAPGLIPEVARTGRAVRIGDVTETRIYRPGPGLEDTRSEMVIPIRMAGRVLGVIDLQSELSDAFSEEDLILMQALADSVAVAIRNAALYTAERRRRSLADSLRDIGAALVSDLDLDRVLSRILSGLGRVVTLDTAAILLFEPETASLVVAAATGQSGSEGIVGKQLSLKGLDRLGEEELEALVREAYHELLDVADVHSCIAAPLVVGGSRIGYLIADYYQPGHYGQFDREIVRAFANQAAVAINNARLYAAQQEEAWVTTALLQVAETVNAQVEVGETLETIARLTALLAGVTRCLILRWDASSGLCYPGAQFGIAAERYNELAASPLPAREHPFLELLTLVDEPLGAGEGYQLHLPEPVARLMMASSVLGFPLRAKGETVGLLLVDDPRRGQAADPRLLNILTGIAHQTATALEAAMLQARLVERDRLEQELRVAHDIQASFIPEVPPQEPGWQIAATWRAAHQVSGDFYDFIPLRDGLWGLVIADVADKGIPAALFMAVCRTLLRAAAISRTSPAETLIRMNQLLFNDSRGDLFVTVFYAVWNPLTGRVTYASGGHNPALLVRGGERPRVTALRCRGIALGVLPEIELEEHGVTLHVGDMLVAYTDGVTEAMRADYTEWGLERFRATLRRFHALPVEQIMGRVLGAIDEFIGGAPQSDDLTFWIL
ncbi:MAG TPA: GAF domain-containing protein, partial [Chloroflexi bacterium]|nr:GAF domain-containing protein [Chloroflexota bacterium]